MLASPAEATATVGHLHMVLLSFAEYAQIAAGTIGDVFVPQNRQGDVLALRLAVYARSVRLLDAPMASPAVDSHFNVGLTFC